MPRRLSGALHVLPGDLVIHLSVGNSTSQITGLNKKQEGELRLILSYLADASQTYHSGNPNRRRYLIDKKGNFPTGLLGHVADWLLAKCYLDVTIQDTRVKPQKRPGLLQLDLEGLTPYPDQLEAATAAARSGKGIITMPTGTGKSLTMALLMDHLQLKTLVVVPTLELKRQLSETFTELFGSLEHITVENIGSPSLERKGSWDCLIIDEAHHSGAKTYRTLNKKFWNGIYHRYFFTATPFRSRTEEQILFESVCGQVVYRLDYLTSVEKGYIVPVEAYYVELPKKDVDLYSWASVYKHLIVENEFRNGVIKQLMEALSYTSTLCLVKEMKHGENLGHEWFAHGQNEDTKYLIQMFNSGKLKTLVGTTGVLGEGIDTKTCEYVIIAGLGKSKNAFMQQVGRGVRRYPGKESCKVILFKDISHKFTLRHFQAQCRYLKEEFGVTPVKLDLTFSSR